MNNTRSNIEITAVTANSNSIKSKTSDFPDLSLIKKGGINTPRVGLNNNPIVNKILMKVLLQGLNQLEATLVGQLVIKLLPIPQIVFPIIVK